MFAGNELQKQPIWKLSVIEIWEILPNPVLIQSRSQRKKRPSPFSLQNGGLQIKRDDLDMNDLEYCAMGVGYFSIKRTGRMVKP